MYSWPGHSRIAAAARTGLTTVQDRTGVQLLLSLSLAGKLLTLLFGAVHGDNYGGHHQGGPDRVHPGAGGDGPV